jgi:phage terminase large subunit-like protein
MQTRSLIHIPSGIKIEILAPTLENAIGRRPSLLLVDELAVLAASKDATAMLNQLRQGGKNFGADFKSVTITTMPTGSVLGEMSRLLEMGEKIRKGEIVNNDFLPIIGRFPLLERPDLDYMDSRHWYFGMFSLRTKKQSGTMDASELEAELEKAATAGDTNELSLILSQRLGIVRSLIASNTEMQLHTLWNKALQTDRNIPESALIVGGVDVGGLDDPLAITWLWQKDGITNTITNQYLTRSGYERAHATLRRVYDEAIAFGSLALFETPDKLDAQFNADCIQVIEKQCYGITLFGGDLYGRAGWSQRFKETVADFVQVKQDFKLGAALNEIEARLSSGTFAHCNDPLMNFNVECLQREETSNGNWRLKKKDADLSGQSSKCKIDGFMSLCNAMILYEECPSKSFDASAICG